MKYRKPLNPFEEVKQVGKRMLSVDTGEKYSGLSIIGKGLLMAVPFKTCNMNWNKKPGQLGNYLMKLIIDCKVGGLLVGYSSMEDRSLEIDHHKRVFEWLNSVHVCPWLKYFPFTLVDAKNAILGETPFVHQEDNTLDDDFPLDDDSKSDDDNNLANMFFEEQSEYIEVFVEEDKDYGVANMFKEEITDEQMAECIVEMAM
ncbi:hypothetical protein Q3G72_023958 [Acer saccharum]|nr:hypothetical protein Q3G72_023958 [Acer saccharum]